MTGATIEPGDGDYGFDLAALRAVPPVPPPPGFAERWRSWHDEALAIDPDPRVRPLGRREGRELFAVEHVVSGGLRLGGWFATAMDGHPTRVGIVHSHGYGGREEPEFDRVPDDAAVFFALARGQGRLNAGIGAPTPAEGHVLHGIRSIDDYVLGRCAVDLWHAGSALRALAGDLPLYLVGESFGGGIGALALPWDERIVGATLIVPSFGQYDLRLRMPCEGSGERVRRYVAKHPSAREVLRFFDASTAAGFARVPVRVEAALRDRHVPPPGQFAVANAIAAAPGAELELAVLPYGHREYDGLAEVRAAAFAATRDHISRSLDR
ncbi:acetyl esterase [Microbacterium testaceum]|uniref:acetylxylan esterase n=1 Tax=Microbacterium testaceum TaxID=2033 RepID=UPI000734EAC5|nr:acetylxylan esterase [Microbacterium testaceum]KTS65204.1 acetyl esterase [Microbacterium testaceum]